MEKTKMTTEELRELISEIMKEVYEFCKESKFGYNYFLRLVFACVAGTLEEEKIPYSKVYHIIDQIYQEVYQEDKSLNSYH